MPWLPSALLLAALQLAAAVECGSFGTPNQANTSCNCFQYYEGSACDRCDYPVAVGFPDCRACTNATCSYGGVMSVDSCSTTADECRCLSSRRGQFCQLCAPNL
jgi:hypothetical protein